MTLPDIAPPLYDLPSQEKQHRFHDGSTRVLRWVDLECPYPDGKLIVSRTNREGIITHANDAFVQMSGGYTLEELLGSPHHILRHPEMPSCVFQDIWEKCRNREKWHGYVKNLRKDGAHYWVYASVVPNVRNGQVVGFTSVRRKPSRTKINEIIPLYAQYLQQEKS